LILDISRNILRLERWLICGGLFEFCNSEDAVIFRPKFYTDYSFLLKRPGLAFRAVVQGIEIEEGMERGKKIGYYTGCSLGGNRRP